MSSRGAIATLLVLMILTAPSAPARILHVPEEYPEIWQACCAAVSGDTVAVAPGIYGDDGGSVKPGVSVIGMGEEMNDVVVTMSNGIPFGIPPGDEEAVIQNLSIEAEGAYASCIYNGNPHSVIRGCHLEVGGWMSTALVVTEADMRIEWCKLRPRVASYEGQAIQLLAPCEVIVADCRWTDPTILITDQPAGSRIVLRNNVLMDGISVATSPSGSDFTVRILNSIIRGSAYCISSWCVPDTLEWLHNDFYDITYGPPGPDCGTRAGNISEDPMFCNPSEYDYRLDWASPCRNAGLGGEDIGIRFNDYCNINTAVEEPPGASKDRLWLSMPWPNPTGAGVSLAFRTPQLAESPVAVRIMDLDGRMVRLLRPDASSERGLIHWDGRDETGRSVPVGTYFLQLRSGGETAERVLRVVR